MLVLSSFLRLQNPIAVVASSYPSRNAISFVPPLQWDPLGYPSSTCTISMNFNNNCNLIISPCLCSEMAAVSVASERVVVNIFMRLRYSFRVVFLQAPLTSFLVVCCTHFNRV